MSTSSPIADTKKNRPVILITGASSGLGAGMATRFAKKGYDLALCARRVEKLEGLRSEILEISPETRVELASLDVNDHDAVFAVFEEFQQRFGKIDRVIINAGIGDGAPIGKGGFQKNKFVLETNLIAALAQSEAGMKIFREQKEGHLVIISSTSAFRGLRSGMNCYSTSKAAVAHMAEGIRADMLNKPNIDVSTIFPGYIESEMTVKAPNGKTPFIVSNDKGCDLLVKAIESRKAKAIVPAWPWTVVCFLMKRLPLSWVMKLL